MVLEFHQTPQGNSDPSSSGWFGSFLWWMAIIMGLCVLLFALYTFASRSHFFSSIVRRYQFSRLSSNEQYDGNWDAAATAVSTDVNLEPEEYGSTR